MTQTHHPLFGYWLSQPVDPSAWLIYEVCFGLVDRFKHPLRTKTSVNFVMFPSLHWLPYIFNWLWIWGVIWECIALLIWHRPFLAPTWRLEITSVKTVKPNRKNNNWYMNYHSTSPEEFVYQRPNSIALFWKRALGQTGKSKEMSKWGTLDHKLLSFDEYTRSMLMHFK